MERSLNLYIGLDERFEIPLDELQDDMTWTKRGVSFIDNIHNGLFIAPADYLIECRSDTSMARSNRCGGGLAILKRRYVPSTR
jgi:hypothetical protein